MSPKLHLPWALLTLGFCLSGIPRSADAVDFAQEILPLLETHCLDCHDTETLKGGIGLETFYHASLPTDAGEPLFVPGKPEDSVLFHVVTETDPEKMLNCVATSA